MICRSPDPYHRGRGDAQRADGIPNGESLNFNYCAAVLVGITSKSALLSPVSISSVYPSFTTLTSFSAFLYLSILLASHSPFFVPTLPSYFSKSPTKNSSTGRDVLPIFS